MTINTQKRGKNGRYQCKRDILHDIIKGMGLDHK